MLGLIHEINLNQKFYAKLVRRHKAQQIIRVKRLHSGKLTNFIKERFEFRHKNEKMVHDVVITTQIIENVIVKTVLWNRSDYCGSISEFRHRKNFGSGPFPFTCLFPFPVPSPV